MDVKPVVDRWLTPSDYLALGQAVANGYDACEKVMKGSAALSMFGPGIEHRSYLNHIFVQYALTVISAITPGWHYAIEPNQARNCWHVRLFIKTRCTVTAHFLGRTNLRSAARPAVNRAMLASINGDLFQDEAEQEYGTHLYCHLLHAGEVIPEFALLSIPLKNQLGHYGALKITVPKPEIVPVEKISEELFFKLRAETAKDVQKAD